MKLVKCHNCQKVFSEMEITIPGHCPYCEAGFFVSEKTSEHEWQQSDLKAAWLAFGDIPIDDYDLIMEPFMDWPAGTDRFEIWHWFDERYAGGVHSLTIYAEEEEE